MANICIILGASGTGKSTSIKGLKPEETIVFNTLKKRLPFKGSSSLYSRENRNLFSIEQHDKLCDMLENISEKGTHVKNIIIDDSIYVMRKEYFDRSKEKGYDKYTELAVHFQNVIETCEKLREDLNVFFILHSEPVVTDGSITTYKVSTIGSLLDKQYNPVEVVPMVLFSSIKFEDNKPKYGFYTHATLEKGAVIPAKSPEGMFEDDFIPNDLGYVVDAIEKYY